MEANPQTAEARTLTRFRFGPSRFRTDDPEALRLAAEISAGWPLTGPWWELERRLVELRGEDGSLPVVEAGGMSFTLDGIEIASKFVEAS